MTPLPIILLMPLLAQAPLAADVYKWVDAQGRVHFGDRPPAGAGEPVPIDSLPGAPRPAPDAAERAEKRQRLLEIYQEDRQAKKAAAEKRRQELMQREQQCRQARQALESYQNATGIYEEGESGERRYLSFEARARYIEQLRQEVERLCR